MARIGELLDDRYEIEGILGEGGLGVVYRGRHTKLDRPFAIKLMHPQFAGHGELRRRFDREARALSTLVHKNIVAITDYGSHEGAPYLVMELVEGETLSARLERSGPPRIDETIEILRQLLVGLKAAHAQGVLHRDLKPGNIMLRRLPGSPIDVVIVDFGLAKIADPAADGPPDPTLTKLGTIMGTPSYMSPEQVATTPADERADLYAAGVILFEMLTGRPPFVDDNKMEVLRAHLATEVPAPESLRRGLAPTPALTALLDRALAKDRDERFASADEMLRAVEALPTPAAVAPEGVAPPTEALASAPTLEVGSSMIETAPRRSPVRRRVVRNVLAAGGALALAAGVAIAVGFFGGGDAVDATEPRGETTSDPSAGSTPSPSAAPRPPAHDPLAAGVPSPIRRLYRRVRRGHPLSRDQQRRLRDYQRDHMDDPRPSLILAHDHYNQQWYSDAIDRYRIVDAIDPAARGNAWFRDDLFGIIGSSSHGDQAAELLRAVYGAEAVVEIERRLSEDAQLAEDERARLERLLDRLRS